MFVVELRSPIAIHARRLSWIRSSSVESRNTLEQSPTIVRCNSVATINLPRSRIRSPSRGTRILHRFSHNRTTRFSRRVSSGLVVNSHGLTSCLPRANHARCSAAVGCLTGRTTRERWLRASPYSRERESRPCLGFFFLFFHSPVTRTKQVSPSFLRIIPLLSLFLERFRIRNFQRTSR